MDGVLAEIRMFGGNFAPHSWAYCEGQILSIAQNTALFSLVGTTYGGDGMFNFALPDFRGRVPIGVGQGPGMKFYQLGQIGGMENTSLSTNNLPAHAHTVAIGCSSNKANSNSPGGNYPAVTEENPGYHNLMNNTMNTATTAVVGSSQPFSIMQPYLGINFVICLAGSYPSRS